MKNRNENKPHVTKVQAKIDQEGYNKRVEVDPAKKFQQAADSKVQNPNRNLAKGGNNMPYKKK